MTNRKEQIIDITFQLIQQKGYVAFSYDDISKQLGVTKASIHYHFERKEDLGVALAERIAQNLKNLLLSIKDSSLSIEEKLILFIQKRAERFTCTEICPITSLQMDFESLPEVVRQKVEEISQLELLIMNEIIAEAHTEGIVSDLEDIQSFSATILTSIKGALIYRRVLGDDILSDVLKQIKWFFRKP
jgi:TetR/AcrR family transcriptional regulator, transcriptional repressor for nem operon